MILQYCGDRPVQWGDDIAIYSGDNISTVEGIQHIGDNISRCGGNISTFGGNISTVGG